MTRTISLCNMQTRERRRRSCCKAEVALQDARSTPGLERLVSAKILQSGSAGNGHGCPFQRDQMFVLKLAQYAGDGFTGRADTFGDLLMSQSHLHLRLV